MDARASLLIDGTNGLGDPMAGAPVTILGGCRARKRRREVGLSIRRHSDASTAQRLIAAEPELLHRMNTEHAELLAQCGAAIAARSGNWRLAGVDPEGCDLIAGGLTARLDFPQHVDTPEAANNALMELANRFGGDAGSEVG
jgi:hypothetical protein